MSSTPSTPLSEHNSQELPEIIANSEINSDINLRGFDDQIYLAFAADEAFAVPLVVAVTSVLISTTIPSRLSLYILDCGLSKETLEYLATIASKCKLSIVSVDSTLLSQLPPRGHLKVPTYARLMLGELIPESVERIIYLDSDLLVQGDVAELWEFDLGDSLLGATTSTIYPYIGLGSQLWRVKGIDPGSRLFNAGVLLINMAQWREARVGSECLDLIRTYPEFVIYADQDALNVATWGRTATLPLRWNQEHALRDGSHHAFAFADPLEIKEAVEKPAIIHFTGRSKPWLYFCADPATKLWRKAHRSSGFRLNYRKRSSWRDTASDLLRALNRVLRCKN